MTVYLDLVMVLNFLVDFLLLIAANRLCGFRTSALNAVIAALLGAVYAGGCLMPGFSFLANGLWRIVSLAGMCIVAFGLKRSALRRSAVFCLLSMSLGGIALVMNSNGFWGIVGSAAGITLLCLVGFHGSIPNHVTEDIILVFRGKRRVLRALLDTGNLLKDPISGESVTVVDGEIGAELLGIPKDALLSPVSAVEAYPEFKLRLIPYRTVGQPGGMLLGLRMDSVYIGKKQAGNLVAFAPQKLESTGKYQALTGGVGV